MSTSWLKKRLGLGSKTSALPIEGIPVSASDAAQLVTTRSVFVPTPPPAASNSTLLRQLREELDRTPATMLPQLQQLVKIHEKRSDSLEVTRQVESIKRQENRAALLAPRVETHALGLVNLGNTCYANAMLQCLFRTPAFTDTLVRFDPTAARERLAPKKRELDEVVRVATEAELFAAQAAHALREIEARRLDPALSVAQHGQVLALREMLGASWSEEALVFALRRYAWDSGDAMNAHFEGQLKLPAHLDPANAVALERVTSGCSGGGGGGDEGSDAAPSAAEGSASPEKTELERAIEAERDAFAKLVAARHCAAEWDLDITITERVQELFGSLSCVQRAAVDANDVLGGAEALVSGVPGDMEGAVEFCGRYKVDGYVNANPLYLKISADSEEGEEALEEKPSTETGAVVPQRCIYRHEKAWLFTTMAQMRKYCNDEEYRCNIRSNSSTCATPFGISWDVWHRAQHIYCLANTATGVPVLVERAEAATGGAAKQRGCNGCGGMGLFDLLRINVKDPDAPNLFFHSLVSSVRRATVNSVSSAAVEAGEIDAASPPNSPTQRRKPRSVSFCDDVAEAGPLASDPIARCFGVHRFFGSHAMFLSVGVGGAGRSRAASDVDGGAARHSFGHLKRSIAHSPGLAPITPQVDVAELSLMPSSGFVEKSSLYSCLARNRLYATPNVLTFYLERTPLDATSWDATFRFDTLLYIDPYLVYKPWDAAAQMGVLQGELQELETRLHRLTNLHGSSVITTIDTLLAQLPELTAVRAVNECALSGRSSSGDGGAVAPTAAPVRATSVLESIAADAPPPLPMPLPPPLGAEEQQDMPRMLRSLRMEAQAVVLELRQKTIRKRQEIKALFARSSSQKYELQSLVIRSGGNPSDATAAASVHYYAYSRDVDAADGTWLRLDDARVTRGIAEDVVLTEGYGGAGLQKFATFVFFARRDGTSDGGGYREAAEAAVRMREHYSRELSKKLAGYERRVANVYDHSAAVGDEESSKWTQLVAEVTEAKLRGKGYIDATGGTVKIPAEQLADRAKEFGMKYEEFRAQVLSDCDEISIDDLSFVTLED